MLQRRQVPRVAQIVGDIQRHPDRARGHRKSLMNVCLFALKRPARYVRIVGYISVSLHIEIVRLYSFSFKFDCDFGLANVAR